MVGSLTWARQNALSNAMPFLSLGHSTYFVSFFFLCSLLWSILFLIWGTRKKCSKPNQRRKLKKHSLISISGDMSCLKKRGAVDFHFQRTFLALYLSNLLVRLLIQAIFLAILIRVSLPKVNDLPISCSNPHCPPRSLHLLGYGFDRELATFIPLIHLLFLLLLSLSFALFLLYTILNSMYWDGHHNLKSCTVESLMLVSGY